MLPLMINNDWLVRDLSQEFGLNTDTWSLSLRSDIEAYTLHAFKNFLDMYVKNKKKNAKNPKLILTCHGGDVLVAFAIIDIMNEYKKVHRILVDVDVYGYAASAAVMLVACATGRRRISSSSYLMIHSIKSNFDKAVSTTNLERQMQTGKRVMDTYTSMMLKSTSLPRQELEQSLSFDVYYSSQEALSYKVVDEII